MTKYVFFGTPEFAAIILERLIKAGLAPAAVVTNPDRPVGRDKVLMATPVKTKFLEYTHLISDRDISEYILQPEELGADFVEKIKDSGVEVGVLAAYGKILLRQFIQTFPEGIIGVHPSLLPKYRGSTPIQSAILNGDEETGVTLFLMDEQIDHGSIIIKKQETITNDDNYQTLMRKLAGVSADLLIDTLPKYLAGEIKPVAQDEARATYTKKFTMEDARVDLDKDPPELIWRKVRALNPEPGTWTIKDGKRLKILEVDLLEGKIILKKIQFEGKTPRTIA